MHRSTLAIHAGRGPRTPGGPLNPPLVMASSFHGGDYAREQGAPTWEAFEEALGALEGGRAVAFASGTAAAAAILETLPAGARVVGPERGYAWTRSLLAERAATGRIVLQTVDTCDTDGDVAWQRGRRTCCGSSRRAIRCWRWPSSTVCAGVASRSRWTRRSPRRCCSGRWSSGRRSPCTARRSSSAGTRICCSAWSACATTFGWSALRHARAQVGATPGTLEAFLALRGLRTLPVRLELSQRTASTLAERLSAHPAVGAVHYPGFGAMLSFEVGGDPLAVCRAVRVFTHAKSLGGVESLIDVRGPSLLRLSVGCEHVEDLWNDLELGLVVPEDRA